MLYLSEKTDNWNEGLNPELTSDMHLIYPFHNLYEHTCFSIFDLLWVRDFNVEISVEYDYATYKEWFFSMDVMTKIFCNFGAHQHYMRSLPLHLSQKELCSCNEYADFELTLRPTYDFIMELQRYGTMIEVMEPQSLRQTMKCCISDLSRLYKSD